MLAAALFSIAISFAGLSIGGASVFSIWLRRQAGRVAANRDFTKTVPRGSGTLTKLANAAPEVVVVLCVRGHDPYLADTIRALSRQNYANYRILVVVDHFLDPAWQVVSDVKQELGLHDLQFELQELAERRDQCGLKCSSLLQAIESLTKESEGDRVIVTIDSDAVPGRDWLANLVWPLLDESVGATTSNQWFEPGTLSLGAWVRAVWQAGAIVPTAMLSNPWAGSFAIRQSDLFVSGLVDAWRTSIIDDGPVRHCLQKIGKRIEFVPQNVVINREDCGLSYCFRYVARMLTWSRLFESTFWMTGVHAALTALIHLIVLAWCGYELFGVVNQEWTGPVSNRLFWSVGAVAVLLFGQVLGYWIVRQSIFSQSAATRPNLGATTRSEVSKLSWLARMFFVTLAVPLATAAYVYGCVRATRVKQVVWRKIAYQVENGRQVKMLEYSPFAVEPTKAVENHSV